MSHSQLLPSLFLIFFPRTIFSSTDAADDGGQSLKDFRNILKNLNGQRRAAKAARSTNTREPDATGSDSVSSSSAAATSAPSTSAAATSSSSSSADPTVPSA